MSKDNDGGSAFPTNDYISTDGQRQAGSGSSGMSLRDYFAAAALIGIMTKPEGDATYHNESTGEIAMDAYTLADAMLAEREK